LAQADLTDTRLYVKVRSTAIAQAAPALLGDYVSPFTGARGADNPLVFAGDPDHRGAVGARRTSMVYQHHRREGSAGVAAGPVRRLDTRGAGSTPVGLGTLTTRGGGHVRSGLGGAGSSSWWRRRRTPRAPTARRHRQ
jgi:hypothetical protein